MTIIKPTPKTIQNLIRVIPDHPRPGVLYQDMASIFNAPQGLQHVMTLFSDYIEDNNIHFNKIIGLDARGFPMAGALSSQTGIPFSMARKKGKLPGETIFTEYELEYGTDELHLQKGAIQKDDKVLVIDDVIATGGTLGAVITLTELLAEEYKETGPQFNILALGAVQTEMLEEAFPGYLAPTTAIEMAEYIFDFSLNGNKYYNGKVLQVSNSTP